MFHQNDQISEQYLSNPSAMNMNMFSANAAPQLTGERYINSSSTTINHPNAVHESYATCGGGLATLDRVQYYPERTGHRRYRNNNETCRNAGQCASGYCNMTPSGSPAQNIYNAWNQPNYQIGVCADVDNGLPSDLRPVLPPSEIDITINDVRKIKESYREGQDRNFDDLFNDCIYQTYWNGVPNSYPPLKLAASCRQIVAKYKKAQPKRK